MRCRKPRCRTRTSRIAEFTAAGYHSVFSGQKTYNGVALLSRLPMTDVVRDIPDFDDPPRRVLAATIGDFRVINLYVPNGQAPGSEKFAYKLRWLAALTRWLAAEAAQHPGLVVLGDFNIAPEDRDVHDPAAWVGSVHVSPRSAPRSRRITGPRAGRRIPAIRAAGEVLQLVGLSPGRLSPQQRPAHRPDPGAPAAAAALRGVRIDVDPRRVERASDHTPVIAEFASGLTTAIRRVDSARALQ